MCYLLGRVTELVASTSSEGKLYDLHGVALHGFRNITLVTPFCMVVMPPVSAPTVMCESLARLANVT